VLADISRSNEPFDIKKDIISIELLVQGERSLGTLKTKMKEIKTKTNQTQTQTQYNITQTNPSLLSGPCVGSPGPFKSILNVSNQNINAGILYQTKLTLAMLVI
jgi:hypothetical protein